MADVELLPLPEPYGYLRELDGGLQMSIGPVRPADRAGGYATPWAAMYDPGRVRANVAHATAAKDAEIERLRALLLEACDDGDEADADLLATLERARTAEARAERLAEALRLAEERINDLTPEWYSAGQRVLAEIRAALRDHDQEGKDG